MPGVTWKVALTEPYPAMPSDSGIVTDHADIPRAVLGLRDGECEAARQAGNLRDGCIERCP